MLEPNVQLHLGTADVTSCFQQETETGQDGGCEVSSYVLQANNSQILSNKDVSIVFAFDNIDKSIGADSFGGHLDPVDVRNDRLSRFMPGTCVQEIDQNGMSSDWGVNVPNIMSNQSGSGSNAGSSVKGKENLLSCAMIYKEVCDKVGPNAGMILENCCKVEGLSPNNDSIFHSVLPSSQTLNIDLNCLSQYEPFSFKDGYVGGPKVRSAGLLGSFGMVREEHVQDDFCLDWGGATNVYYDALRGFDRYSVYSPVIIDQKLEIWGGPLVPSIIGGMESQLNLQAWCWELDHENDSTLKNYILHGVSNGFDIVDRGAKVPSYQGKYYRSSTNAVSKPIVDKMFSDELKNGKYLKVLDKPQCIHGIGAITKPDGSLRLISDCRMPIGQSINNFMSETFKEFSYTSVINVVDLLDKDFYMCSIDISAAYRSIPVSKDQWGYQGVEWIFDGVQTYMVDCNLSFGLRAAPYIFTQVSNFVTRCLMRRGFTRVINYLDDFLVIGSSFKECESAQLTLIRLLRSLGFFVNWRKTSSPSRICVYLGIEFNSINMSVSLPAVKLEKFLREISFFRGRDRATVHQIQRLCGIIAHCSKIVKGGRTFASRLIFLLKGISDPKARLRLDDSFKEDITWWSNFAKIFNGQCHMIPYNYGEGVEFFSDSSQNGYGAWLGLDWVAGYFNSSSEPVGVHSVVGSHCHWINVDLEAEWDNINVLELVPVWLALLRWAPFFRDKHLVCRTDNTQVRSMINKGFSSNPVCMKILRAVFWICAVNNVHVTARHIQGIHNDFADNLSRIFSSNSLVTQLSFPFCCSNLL